MPAPDLALESTHRCCTCIPSLSHRRMQASDFGNDDSSAAMVERLTGTLEKAVSSLENLHACEGDANSSIHIAEMNNSTGVEVQACALKKEIQQAKQVRKCAFMRLLCAEFRDSLIFRATVPVGQVPQQFCGVYLQSDRCRSVLHGYKGQKVKCLVSDCFRGDGYLTCLSHQRLRCYRQKALKSNAVREEVHVGYT